MAVKQKEPVIKADWCKGCGICVAFCPKNVLAMKNNKVTIANGDACNGCGLCELRCPDFAIYLEEDEKDE